MKRYKLTTQDMRTRPYERNETRWVVGKWVEAIGDPEQGLCSDAYIHWYDDPLLAILLNPVHACLDNPRLWEVETEGKELTDEQAKGGSRRVRLVREIDVPEITMEMCVTFAILCVKVVYQDREWNTWADRWLSGEDRTKAAARIVADAADTAAYGAARDAYAAAPDAAALAAALADAYAADAATRAAARAAALAARYAAGYGTVADATHTAAYVAINAAATGVNLKKIVSEAILQMGDRQ